MKTLLCILALAGATLSAAAQTASEPQFKSSCQEYNWGRNDNKRFCETRDMSMDAPAGQPLVIDGGTNGGISVHGWDGPNVRVRARVQSWGRTEAAAQAQVKGVSISATKGTLRASGENSNNWSVSYEVFVPRQTALALSTINGGISLDNLQADITFKAVNGGVSLASLGGQVTGQTVNGGLDITLTGSQWNGKGLDVETTNGGIHWKMPRDYSARLFTSTNMGNLRTDLAVTKTGMMHRELDTNLGKGGPSIRAVTTNGGITVDQN